MELSFLTKEKQISDPNNRVIFYINIIKTVRKMLIRLSQCDKNNDT